MTSPETTGMASEIDGLMSTIITLSTVLGLAIGRNENPKSDYTLAGNLLLIFDMIDKCGVQCFAIDALRAGLKVGLEPPGPDDDPGAKVVQLFKAAA